MTKSFFDLKPGDQVILGLGSNSKIVTIDRVTKTQIIIGSRRFSRETGQSCETYWPTVLLRIATPELIAEVEKQ